MKEWFKYDYDAADDPKVIELRIAYGMHGLGLWVFLLGKLYKAGGRLVASELPAIAYTAQIPFGEFKEFVDKCVALELLTYDNESKFYANQRCTTALGERNDRSAKATESVRKRYDRTTNVEHSYTDIDIDIDKEKIYTPLTPQGGEVRVSTEIPTPTTEEEKIEARLHVAKKYAPKVDDVVTYGLSRGIPQAEMIEFWDWHDQRGWTLSDGKPVVKWRVRFDSWMRKKGLMP